MTLHREQQDVGVRELHDRLSDYLERVSSGVDVIVTRRGRPIARLTAIEQEDELQELVRRGLVRLPERPRTPRSRRVASRGGVSDLVAEQRR